MAVVSVVLILASTATAATPSADEPTIYRSPYSIQFTYPTKDLINDILTGDRGKPEIQSTIPADRWYSRTVREKYGAWGPPARAFDPPERLADKPAAWRRERVLAIALRYEGYSYQHHHLPDFDPPPDWPWLEVGRGHNAKGVDCSNFTGLVYNLALGVKLSGDINVQAQSTELKFKGRTVSIQKIDKPDAYQDCAKQFRTGDLLYVKDKAGKVSHVVLWVGSIGRSPGDVPLVLDSTGTGHTDSNGHAIPDGVRLRPFNEKVWYWQSLSHVHRVISDQ